jgi:hypothetical protein
MRNMVAVVGLVTALAGCTTGLVQSYSVYESKAANTAKSVVSAVQTARVAVQTAAEHRTFGRYLVQVLGEAEDDASGAQSTFDGIQPPDKRSDDLRNHLDELLTSAVDSISDLRITARRGQFGELARQAQALGSLADKLQAFVEAHK